MGHDISSHGIYFVNEKPTMIMVILDEDAGAKSCPPQI
jgi:hypothetical protein